LPLLFGGSVNCKWRGGDQGARSNDSGWSRRGRRWP
jgi:hypothetical protein